jgi:hypothetical protein
MPASLPGATTAQNLANPSQGMFVIFDPLSGPKGSPLDAKRVVYTATNSITAPISDVNNLSTGGLSTGIGIGANRVINISVGTKPATAPQAIYNTGYDDNTVPGTKPTYAAPPPIGTVATNTINSTIMYIGGGRMIKNNGVTPADRGRPWIPSPYTAGVAIIGAGNGGSRDAGAGPAFTGFPLKMVTAAGAVAIGAAVETGFTNRSGVALVTGQSVFGSDAAASAVPAIFEDPPAREAQKPEIKREPVAEQRPAPKVEPPKYEPPKVETKPEPKVEPKK